MSCPHCGFAPPTEPANDLWYCRDRRPCWPKKATTPLDSSHAKIYKHESDESKIGWFLIVFIIAGFGADLMACGVINAFSWNVFDYYDIEPENWWWLHALCLGFGALVAAGSVANLNRNK